MTAAVFTHVPRVRFGGSTRYFGATLDKALEGQHAGIGMRLYNGCSTIVVLRPQGGCYATISIDTNGAVYRHSLKPHALRELARCLIDAAADIEQEEGGAS